MTHTPDPLEALAQSAAALHRAGRATEAEQAYRAVLARAPDHAEAWNGLGVLQGSQGKTDAAAASFEAALKATPGDARASCNLGLMRQQQGRLDDAVALYRRALVLAPDLVEARVNLGLALALSGHTDEAEAVLRGVLADDPGQAEAHMNLGALLERRGDIEAAMASYGRALAVRPGLVQASNNLGNLLKARGDLAGAEARFRAALAADPDHAAAHMNLGMLKLMQGEFEAGWAGYRWRAKALSRRPAPLASPAWDGGDLAGRTILLRHEQGLGDTIQFCRFVGAVRARGAGPMVLQVPTPLVRLLAEAFDGVRVISEDETAPQHDVQAMLMDLPGLLAVTLSTIPDAPYLRVPADRTQAWRARLAALPGLKIGLVWRGNPLHQDDAARSVPAARLAVLAAAPGLSLVCLQKDATAEERAGLGVALDAAALCEDFADTAACVAALDLTISVDTAVCHLAGALGRPVWALIAAAPDWRWMAGRDDSPWYPTLRLFRQAAPGDWAGVLEQVCAALCTGEFV